MLKVTFLKFNGINDDKLIDDIYKNLPLYIKERIDSVNSKKRKRETLFSWYLIKKTLFALGYDINDFEFLTSDNGKPCVKGNAFYFNISHSHGICACVVSSCECGIDIECVKDYPKKVSDAYFFENEKELIKNSHNKNDTFYKIWTLKESYIKMKALGVFDIKDIKILSLDPVKANVKDAYLYTFDLDGFKLSLSLSALTSNVELCEIKL